MEKIKLRLVLFLFFLVGFGLFVFKKSPHLISFQDKIDPQNIKDDYQADATTAIFNNQPVPVPTQLFPDTDILGVGDSQAATDKRIEVDLTNQRVYGFENGRKIYDFLTSTGTWGRTPTGTFKIWTKIRSQKMSGGSRELGTYYYLPNVPHILFFYNSSYPKQLGYSLHGTYWHENFGVVMSHGCVNMKTKEVAQIFAWADLDTPITIYGKYQTSLPHTFHP